MRPPLAPSPRRTRSRKSASRKARGTAVIRSPARRDAERDIRGFALRLVEEGNWDVVGSQSPRTVDSGHDEPSTRSMR
jgi:catalase